jgi:hypothetical protein
MGAWFCPPKAHPAGRIGKMRFYDLLQLQGLPFAFYTPVNPTSIGLVRCPLPLSETRATFLSQLTSNPKQVYLIDTF